MARREADSQSKTSCCLIFLYRYFMFLFGILAVSVGSYILYLAFYLYLNHWHIIALLHSEKYVQCLSMFAAIGLVLIFSSLFAFCGACYRWSLNVFSCLLIGSLVLEALVAFGSLKYSEVVEREIHSTLLDDILYGYKNDSSIRLSIDRIQVEGKCCGANGFDDWPRVRIDESWERDEYGRQLMTPYVPITCCRAPEPGCSRRDHPSNIYYPGCEPYIQAAMRRNLSQLSNTSIILLLSQLGVTLISLCICLSCDPSKHEKDDPFEEQQALVARNR